MVDSLRKTLGTRRALWIIVLVQTGYSVYLWHSFDSINLELPLYLDAISVLLLILWLLSSVFRCQQLGWSGFRVLAYPVPMVGLVLFIFLLVKAEARK